MRKYCYKNIKGRKRLLYIDNNNTNTKYIKHKGSFVKLLEFKKLHGGFGIRGTRSTVSPGTTPNKPPNGIFLYNIISSHKKSIAQKLKNIGSKICKILDILYKNISDKNNLSEQIPLLESNIQEYNDIELQFQNDKKRLTIFIDIENLDVDKFSGHKNTNQNGGSKKDDTIESKIKRNINNIRKNILKNSIMLNKYFEKSQNEYHDPILLDNFIIILRNCQNIIKDLKNVIMKQLKQRRKELGTVRHVLYKLNPYMDKIYKHDIQVLKEDTVPNAPNIQQNRQGQQHQSHHTLPRVSRNITKSYDVFQKMNETDLLAKYLGTSQTQLDADISKELKELETRSSTSKSSSSGLSRLTSMSTSRSNSRSNSRSKSSKSSLY